MSKMVYLMISPVDQNGIKYMTVMFDYIRQPKRLMKKCFPGMAVPGYKLKEE
ncbi:MAG: hypothetical protein PHO78_07205 [Methanomicrobium sp.]|nr:hypothetical protein [Methanomicrobium sp.]